MKININSRFLWIAATAFIMVFTLLTVGRNLLHAVKIKRQINALEREREQYQAQIDRDSILLEQLKYDDYLEQYAREHYDMQREGDEVYVDQ